MRPKVLVRIILNSFKHIQCFVYISVQTEGAMDGCVVYVHTNWIRTTCVILYNNVNVVTVGFLPVL